jgi:hypothetical protein
VLFILLIRVMAMLDGVGSTWNKVSHYPPWACECKLKLANLAVGSIRAGCPSGKNNVSNVEDAGVVMAGVDELPVPGAMFADQEVGNFMASTKVVG